MLFHLPFNDMPLQDKLAATESLLDDLTHPHEVRDSPFWHQIVPAECNKPFVEGHVRFIDKERTPSILINSKIQRTGEHSTPSSITLYSEGTHGNKGDYNTRDS